MLRVGAPLDPLSPLGHAPCVRGPGRFSSCPKVTPSVVTQLRLGPGVPVAFPATALGHPPLNPVRAFSESAAKMINIMSLKKKRAAEQANAASGSGPSGSVGHVQVVSAVE